MQTEKDTQNVSASIILLAYNSKSDLEECIPSLESQSYKDYEIIVMDNSPNNDVQNFVSKNYPDIKYVKNNSNIGYPAGNNNGLKYAKGKYIIVVNPDTVADNEWLNQLIKPLENNAEVAITNSKVLLYHYQDLVNTFSNYCHFTGLDFCKGLGEPSSLYSKPSEAGAISGCSFATRRDVFEEIGGFDPDFFLYMEDVDLAWRVRLAGYKILAVPSSIIYHKYELSIGAWKNYYLERNRYQMLLKNYSLKMLILIFPAILVAEIITWGHAILQGLPYIKSKLDAYWWVLTNIPGIIEKRKQIQNNRKISDKEFIELLEWRIPFEQVIKNKTLCRIADIVFNTFFKYYFQALKIIA